MAKVILIGAGDMGTRLARGLSGAEGIEVMLCGRSDLDAGDVEAVAGMLHAERPDLVVMCACPLSPWALLGRTDRAAQIVQGAGFGLRLPYLLLFPWTLMRAARLAEYAGPVANLSYPDVVGPVLAAHGLAPTVGLGNVAMIHVRAQRTCRGLPRVVGHHAQVAGVMQGLLPSSPPRTYVDGRCADRLPYLPPPKQPGLAFNAVTAAASRPVLRALLPDAPELRWSVPAPHGLPGGYPVRIADGDVELDLPPDVSEQEAIALNESWACGDGIERIEPDGTVHFTADVHRAVADLDPKLAAPFSLDDLPERIARLDHHLNGDKL